MLKATCKNDGFAIVYGLAVFFLASICGLSVLFISQKDRVSSGDYSKMRSSALVARGALIAFQNQCKTQPQMVIDILKKYSLNSSNKWLLGDAAHANSETQFKCWNGSDAPSFSACIMKFDSVNLLLQVQGIGYGGGKGSGKKKAIGIYRVKGADSPVAWPQKDAIYLAGKGRNFNEKIFVSGDMYFGSDVHFNSGSNGSVINGNLKTAYDKETTSSFDANITINGKVFFGTAIKVNGGKIVTINGKAGFERHIETDQNIELNGDTYFNSTVLGNAKLDLNGYTITHSGELDTANDLVKGSYTKVINKKTDIDIAEALGMRKGAEPSFNGQIDSIPSNLIFNSCSLGLSNITAENLNEKYQNVAAKGKLWNGFLVVKIGQNVTMSSSSGIFNGKVIWIVESTVSCNGNWYDCAASSNTLVYVKTTGRVNQLGSAKNFRGYVYVEGNGYASYLLGNGNSFRGAIHHVSAGADFNINSGAPLNIQYDEEVLKEFVRLKIITPPGLTKLGLTLNDIKLRTELLSIYY